MKYINSFENIEFDNNFIESMSKKFLLDSRVVKLLFARGINTAEKLKEYLNPNISQLHNPMLFENMALVIDKIKSHISNNSSILIYGDYDVDGITATYTLYDYLKKLGGKVEYFLPNRYIDGYGLNIETLDKLLGNMKPDLLITVDCGITAVNEVEYLKSKNIDVIVTDHHESDGNLPNCLIINPKISTTYPFKYLCGAGVALKLVQAIGGTEAIMPYIAATAVATISDIVELVAENRAIVSIGLQNISSLPKGILKLMSECGIGSNPKASEIAFKLAPKINASGRMGDAELSLKLYLETSPSEINKLCKTIIDYNTQRQQLCNKIYNDVKLELAASDIYSMKAIICKSTEWEAGLLGIVCAKLSEEYNRPTCLFSQSGDVLTGSCRSVNGVNVHTLMCSMSNILDKFGGHTMAAGVTLNVGYYDEFCAQFNKYVNENLIKEELLPTKTFDFEVNINEINAELIESVDRMEPCGHENNRPVFKLELSRADVNSMKNHPEHLLIKYNNISLLAFNSSNMQYVLSSGTKCNVLADLNLETYKTVKRVSGVIKNIDYEDIYRPDNMDIITSQYVKQLSFVDEQTAKFANYNRENLIRLLMDMDKSVYGTLIVVNDYNSYLNFKSIYDNFNIFRNRLFEVGDESGINTILLAPTSLRYFNTFKRIIFIDPILNMGYISAINKVTKATIYLPYKTQFGVSTFKNISLDRRVFGEYFNLLKLAYENKVSANSPYDLFTKLVNSFKKKDLLFLQFTVCLHVFKELQIITLNETIFGVESVSMDKKSLDSSQFYNRVKALKNNK